MVRGAGVFLKPFSWAFLRDPAVRPGGPDLKLGQNRPGVAKLQPLSVG